MVDRRLLFVAASVAGGLVVLVGAVSAAQALRAGQLWRHFGITEELARRVVDVADAVGAEPLHLAAVIHFESAGTWSSSTRHPSGEAVGLIQFRAKTAQRLGTTLEELSELSALEQLNYVQDYLARVAAGRWPDPRPGHEGELVPASSLDNLQAVAMAVFYPPAMHVSPTTRFDAPPLSDPRVINANPKTPTPGEYVRLLRKYSGLEGALLA